MLAVGVRIVRCGPSQGGVTRSPVDVVHSEQVFVQVFPLGEGVCAEAVCCGLAALQPVNGSFLESGRANKAELIVEALELAVHEGRNRLLCEVLSPQDQRGGVGVALFEGELLCRCLVEPLLQALGLGLGVSLLLLLLLLLLLQQRLLLVSGIVRWWVWAAGWGCIGSGIGSTGIVG